MTPSLAAAEPLNLQDYLDATGESAQRARTTSIALVVASVVLFAGLLNSIQNSWMIDRLTAFQFPESSYVTAKAGAFHPPSDTGFAAMAYRERYTQLYGALARVYVESAFVVRVPFFGITIDVNDLGLIGGIAF